MAVLHRFYNSWILFRNFCLQDRKDEICSTKRTIHKTTSADAAMMASEVLPVDPQDLGLPKSKPKTSL